MRPRLVQCLAILSYSTRRGRTRRDGIRPQAQLFPGDEDHMAQQLGGRIMWANTSIPAMRCLPSLKDMLARSVVILLMLVLIGQCIHVSAQEPREAALVVKGPPNDEVKAMAISGDRRLVASANWDHTIKVWEAATGRVRVTFQGHSKVARCLAFSPDGKRIASCTFPTLRSDELKIWDTGTGREVLSLGDPARTVCFSFDGKRLASVLDATIHLWDATSGRKLLTLTGHTKQVRSLAFTPDGKSLASSADDESVRVWDLPAGQEKRAFRGQPSEYANSDLAFGPDSKQLALPHRPKVNGKSKRGTPRQARKVLTSVVQASLTSPSSLRSSVRWVHSWPC
jgi:hypothetical protein